MVALLLMQRASSANYAPRLPQWFRMLTAELHQVARGRADFRFRGVANREHVHFENDRAPRQRMVRVELGMLGVELSHADLELASIGSFDLELVAHVRVFRELVAPDREH